MTEAYVMQRYLRPDLLEAAGITVFDSWAATFGQVVTQVELSPEGGDSFRMKSRFASFRNLPEMMKILHVAADIKTAEDLNLPVPALAAREDGQRAPETVTVAPSPELLGYVAELGERADRVRTRAVAPEDDNMLKISGDGRRAALDLRLVGLPQHTPGKTHVAAARIAEIWAAHRDREYRTPDGTPYPVRGSLQIVFCDLGTPGPGWNVYDELRDELVARGLPREAVRFVHEAKSDRDKAQLFAACRAGRIAVLVGSTERMGVGTNVQDRAIALHHLDAPWRPADVAQRDGRILRQGNLNPEVRVLRYVVEQSFDGYLWQTLQRKATFISQVMHNRLDAREIGDIGDVALSFSEVKAIATGNPLLMDKAEADATLARLQRAERAHLRNQDALRHAITRHEREIARLTQLAADIDSAIAHREDTRGDAFAMTIEDRHQVKRAEAGQHLKALLAREVASLDGMRARAVSAGHLGGFTVNAEIERSPGGTAITLGLDRAPGTSIQIPATDLPTADPLGLVARLENRLTRLEERKASAYADMDRAHREISHASQSLGQPFLQAAQLDLARERVRLIDQELQQMAEPPSQPTGQAAEQVSPGPEMAPPSGRPDPGRSRYGDSTEHPPPAPRRQSPSELERKPARGAYPAARHHSPTDRPPSRCLSPSDDFEAGK